MITETYGCEIPQNETLVRARIMTFGYDANVFTKAASQRTFVFAEDLISSLNNERTVDRSIECPEFGSKIRERKTLISKWLT